MLTGVFLQTPNKVEKGNGTRSRASQMANYFLLKVSYLDQACQSLVPPKRSCYGLRKHAWLTKLQNAEIKSESDLLPPGAAPGTIPTDLEQATGLERLEILGKMQGIDIFDMKPLPSDRLGMLNRMLSQNLGQMKDFRYIDL